MPLVNVGSANTTNLVATLHANAGVTNLNAAATYGSVIAGGAAVSRLFTLRLLAPVATNYHAQPELAGTVRPISARRATRCALAAPWRRISAKPTTV